MIQYLNSLWQLVRATRHVEFCETQWRHSVKTRLYNTPSPHTFSFCETQWRHSVRTRLYKNPPPYFIVWASSVKTKEAEVIEFHRIGFVSKTSFFAILVFRVFRTCFSMVFFRKDIFFRNFGFPCLQNMSLHGFFRRDRKASAFVS